MDRGDGPLAVSAARPGWVLVIAGSDPSGGAGLARDLETAGEHGARSAVAVTAVTVQSDRAVSEVEPVAPRLLAAQIRAAFEARPIGAVKIGLLTGADQIEAVAEVLGGHRDVPVVLDPVIASSSGATFLDERALGALKSRLMPLCRLVTPNLSELAILANTTPPDDQREAVAAARSLQGLGARAVLIKGGHAQGANSADILLDGDQEPVRFDAPRVNASLRGTGCLLSSAIACGLASGAPLATACREAKAFVLEKIMQAASAD